MRWIILHVKVFVQWVLVQFQILLPGLQGQGTTIIRSDQETVVAFSPRSTGETCRERWCKMGSCCWRVCHSKQAAGGTTRGVRIFETEQRFNVRSFANATGPTIDMNESFISRVSKACNLRSTILLKEGVGFQDGISASNEATIKQKYSWVVLPDVVADSNWKRQVSLGLFKLQTYES